MKCKRYKYDHWSMEKIARNQKFTHSFSTSRHVNHSSLIPMHRVASEKHTASSTNRLCGRSKAMKCDKEVPRGREHKYLQRK